MSYSSNGNRPKLSEKGLLTPDNCVVALIDHQPQMLFGTSNFDRQTIINNAVAFAKASRVFDVPVVLTTVETKSFSGNMWPQLRAVFPGQEPIERSSMNSWDDKNFVAAIEKTGRKKIVLAGLWTETCVALPTVQAIHDGYEVYVVEDCCGDVSQLAHDNAMKRVIQAGAKPVTSLSTMLEWQRDWAHKETYDAVMDIVKTHYGAYGIGVEYTYTMVHGAPATKFPEYAVPTAAASSQVKNERAEACFRPSQGRWKTKKEIRVSAEVILHNAKIATNGVPSFVEAIAISDGKVTAIGGNEEILRLRGPATRVIDGRGRTVIPGLNDSHMHPIRGGLNYNLELRWDGVPSLADALRMLKEQAARTPAPQWVRVIGGWTEFQFAEGRMPTLDEINAVAPDTPVFVMHLYDRALLNGAALRALGYDKNAPDFPAGEVQRDRHGNPTGLLIAKPNANILYSTLAKGPKLSREDQLNSSRLFFRELNRFGITSVIDAGGGFQNYPDDYGVVNELHRNGELSVRLAYNLFTQKPKQELADFQSWTKMTKPGDGDDFYRVNGAGEMLVFSAADFEDFLVPRPDMVPVMESELKAVIRHLVENRWPFRLHATYNETIERALNVYEEVNREIPFDGLHWFFDHCETITDRNIERVKALGGGIAVQNRMAFQGEYFVERYGAQQAKRTPPIRRMLEMGVPVGAGTDATRVSSYNPYLSLYWLITGKTIGGLGLYPEENRLDRAEALKLYTIGSSWFSTEDGKKGALAPGQLADLAVLSADYFSIPDEEIKHLESVLTIVGGKIVYATEEFSKLAPPALPVSPSWSPVKEYGGYARGQREVVGASHSASCSHIETSATGRTKSHLQVLGDHGLWGLGCDCFAF